MMRLAILLLLSTVAFSETRVRLDTEKGVIVVALDEKKAPATVANFLRYVDAKFYDGAQFHRSVTLNPDNQPNNTVKIEVIQGGTGSREKEFAPIALERTSQTGLKHVDGAISMARDGADTATGDFFICIGAQPELDFGGKRNKDGQGFAAFGKVIQGMDVVKQIQRSPVEAQRLTPPITIRKAERVR